MIERHTRELGQIACLPLGTDARKTTLHPAYQECIRRLYLGSQHFNPVKYWDPILKAWGRKERGEDTYHGESTPDTDVAMMDEASPLPCALSCFPARM